MTCPQLRAVDQSIWTEKTDYGSNGQEAGICTRTVSFTGRDAAGYTTILQNSLCEF
jgi:hypothetical protein